MIREANMGIGISIEPSHLHGLRSHDRRSNYPQLRSRAESFDAQHCWEVSQYHLEAGPAVHLEGIPA